MTWEAQKKSRGVLPCMSIRDPYTKPQMGGFEFQLHFLRKQTSHTHTDDIFLCRVGIVGVHVLYHIGLRSKSLAGGPWLSLLPYLEKQVRFHRMGGGVFVGQRPPPILSGPLFPQKSDSKCSNLRVSRSLHTHAPRRGQKQMGNWCL